MSNTFVVGLRLRCAWDRCGLQWTAFVFACRTYRMHCSCSDFPIVVCFRTSFQIKTVRLCRLRHWLALFMALVGKDVEVSGLVTRADLNGKRGFAEAF